MSRGRKPRNLKGPNLFLRQEREIRGWSQGRLAELLGADPSMISRWERGERGVDYIYQEKLCAIFGKNAIELGFVDSLPLTSSMHYEQSKDLLVKDKEIIPIGTSSHESVVNLSIFDLGVIDKLDSAESIIDLAWDAWFASRPREVARSVNKLLPGLEKIAYSPYPPIHTLRAKNLAIRAHGLLGSVCSDALQNDTALFHYMQAHRFAEEIHDVDLAATYLCLVGQVLRQQNDHLGALSHMETARDLVSNSSSATRGHILQLLAYAYGDTKQEEAFESAISEATELLAFSGEGIDISQKEFIPFEIYEIRGKVYRDLGKPLKAVPYLELAERSLVTADSVTPRWHALLEISRAQAYCDAGNITDGTKLACKGFLMAYQCHSPHQMNRVRKLLRKLQNGPFGNHPGVQDLKNLLYETYMRMDNGTM